MWVLIGAVGGDNGTGFFIPSPVIGWTFDTVLVIETDVEPDRRVK